jgi:hypothetical protein
MRESTATMREADSDRREAARLRYHYRRLILLGRVALPLEAARRIVGPDCAYHLYFRHRPAGRSLRSARTATGGHRRPRRRKRS